jgi:ketosteroid isomerase-like protein
VENELEAQAVVLQVARCADRSDIAAMVRHFSDNAVLVVGERVVEGRQGIFEFFGGGSTNTAATERTKHVVTNIVLASSDIGVAATSYFQVLRSWGLANWGRYEDHFANLGGTWQIVHRHVIVDGHLARPAPPADAAATSRS